MASTDPDAGEGKTPVQSDALGELRWRWSPSVQVRPERFGAIAYHRSEQRLILLQSATAAHLPELLVGRASAIIELAPLDLTEGQVEEVLLQLRMAGVVESLEEDDEPRYLTDAEVP
ncbi:mycofactocin biosynthesis chaperone MftB [Ferrimicrobium sp.]|uniref:mycofactocin biosynthesis chaperone MftB n=1 Tax=Ferrimicrobium sp. TaxID=2926050 RepID=UPI0026164D61|nr:mycofactocin biosynthesis chaperone MftB [Ferrimicrobium sp.]